MFAGSILLPYPEIFLVVGVITWQGGHLTGCFDVSHVTIRLFIKNVLLFCNH